MNARKNLVCSTALVTLLSGTGAFAQEAAPQATAPDAAAPAADQPIIVTGLRASLRGTALMYYGEELGMADLPAGALKEFPLGPKRQVADKRDPVRSPMQWSGDPGAGFTTGASWLPVHPAAGTVNAERQQADKSSMLAWYTGLLRLRRTDPALRSGAYVPLDSGNPRVLVYARRSRSGAGVLVLLNMSGESQTLKITGWPGNSPRAGAVLMTSAPGASANLVDPALEPFAAQLVRFFLVSAKK